MKKLTKMKLINWHRFEDCTIEFGSSTLISGENGAGKSTLLDAIQFVVTCSANAFNKAAHENGKRKLTGYVRCKTGKESRPYERTGEISAHIALEFYEEKRDRYFIVGAVVDSASEGQETTGRYLIDDKRITDEMFLQGNTPRSISGFRAANPSIVQWCKTQIEAKKMIKSRFGRIEDKFFSLIPKALAFKPIDDIKDFVYSYVLDEKEVNIEVLRENVRSYQDLERMLASVKKRMEKLEEIDRSHQAVADCMKKDRMYAFYLSQAEVDDLKEHLRMLERTIQTEEYRGAEVQKELRAVSAEREETLQMETNLRVELKQNQDYLALEEQEKERERLRDEEVQALLEKKELQRSVSEAWKAAGKLLAAGNADACLSEYRSIFGKLDEITDVAAAREAAERVIQYKKEMYTSVQREITEVQIEQQKQQDERKELEYKIKQLERKKLSYPESVNRLLEEIQTEFAQIGRKAEVCVLCEILEITDESWRNAVEGYLNTQRFYILAEPQHFDIALGIYDKLRREKKAYGAGLINTKDLEAYKTAPEGTLASVVVSKNKYAQRFINMVLGKVQMCEQYSELKKYQTSITRTCMKYQNRVASAIRPEIFNVPFIGQNAFKVQLEQAKIERKELDDRMKRTGERLESLQSLLSPLGTEHDLDVKYRLDILTKLSRIQTGIQSCDRNIETLKKNAAFIQKQMQLETLLALRTEQDGKIGKLNQTIGDLRSSIADKKKKIEEETGRLAERQAYALKIAAEAGEELMTWQKDYEKQTGGKSFEQFRGSCGRQRATNETLRQQAESQMVQQMTAYKTEYSFGAAAGMDGFPEFLAVYDRLRTSEILEYEEKVEAARAAAEEEFREQFLAKLQENMKQAQSEFKELNRALKDIAFSNEKYEFLYMPSKKYRNFYEMVMDDFNMMQGESIFSGIFHETHKEVIEELFDRLALHSENQTKTLEEFTDYRTYMDYDIKIIHSDGSYSYYSKVCEEKSGGETQTPFYVTVAASFVQLYGNNIGGEAAGLVMFDEAFNNMDDERIGGVLEFLKRLPLQILVAAPPDKIQYISPAMSETLLVMTDEKISYVERYNHDAL